MSLVEKSPPLGTQVQGLQQVITYVHYISLFTWPAGLLSHLELLCNGMSCSLESWCVQFRLVFHQSLAILCTIELLVYILQYTLHRGITHVIVACTYASCGSVHVIGAKFSNYICERIINDNWNEELKVHWTFEEGQTRRNNIPWYSWKQFQPFVPPLYQHLIMRNNISTHIHKHTGKTVCVCPPFSSSQCFL